MTTACFVLTGYNNTRVYDVVKLRDLCHREHHARLVLVTERPGPRDATAADVVIATPLGQLTPSDPPEATDPPGSTSATSTTSAFAAAKRVAARLGQLGLRPIGVLPFADRGVVLGAELAARFGLPGAEPSRAVLGLDKHRFRAAEAAVSPTAHPDGYTPLRSQVVHSLGAFESAVRRFGGTAFVKPTSEGNSRGCQIVPSVAACPRVWTALAPYHEHGVMVETLVTGAREYSWDFAGGHRWLTEKHTTTGRFRAEYQQIVPAPLDDVQTALLDRAGAHVRDLVSPTNGAFHTELFLLERGVAAVETNLRPGGMHIWDLARLAFPGFDPWREWLRWSTTGEIQPARPRAHAASGIRMLRAPRDGIVVSTPTVADVAADLGIPLHDATLTTAPGQRVRAEVADNAGFVGQIVLVAPDAPTLRDRLDRLSAAVEERIDIDAH
ncbi:biotin carboxylase [Frankia sp. AgPm24]|uniref:ATP-grasp domain-containing protein n=1 Tax=Frankia sp. AgPm24 TaxID=631128 RepID=UPI0020102F7C|nr:biotin carboxylase [Frankia sp. AgPm24]MCK9924913.1 biotin carboxylase [Frankia sp. AgPm24]